MIRYKIDIVNKLYEKGYNSTKIRKEHLFSQSTMTKFRQGKLVSLDNINTLCKLLECQPSDLIEYVEDVEQETK